MSEVWWQRLLLWGRGQTSEDEQDDCSRESCRVGYDVGGGNAYGWEPLPEPTLLRRGKEDTAQEEVLSQRQNRTGVLVIGHGYPMSLHPFHFKVSLEGSPVKKPGLGGHKSPLTAPLRNGL